jgi:ribosomal protein L3
MSDPIEIEPVERTVVEIKVDENSAQVAKEAADAAKAILEELKGIDVSGKLDKGGYTGTAKTLHTQAKIYENGELQIFRKPGTPPDPNNPNPNVGDWCIGFVEDQFINAEFLGPHKLLLTSYNI